jgi:excisionase family DNA binding protein
MTTTAHPETDQPRFSREDLLTPTDVAEVLRLKRTTALDYMRRGVIPAFKIGRSWYALRSRLEAHLSSASHSAEAS